MSEYRLWRCPGCAETYKVRCADPDPLVCVKCDAAQPREVTEFIGTHSGGLSSEIPTRVLWGLGFAALLMFLLAIVSAGRRSDVASDNHETLLPPARSGDNSQPAPARVQPVADDATSNLIGAHVIAKEFCERRLRSPGSAKHPWASYRDTTTALGNHRYRVTSYVDSQNAFGALLRSHYTCVVRDKGNATFELESFQFH